uniref:NADH dehydrogenase subunit 5 n=1 Tax=Hydropsyche cerva TaxID=3381231 RepID=UPI0022372C54|nr:NADH dehydrogenase subunit 5 [Ceratopsyche cerva]UYO79273.1 NADH dehydrogenase subunit 5 [Ceratopsyche cerva]
MMKKNKILEMSVLIMMIFSLLGMILSLYLIYSGMNLFMEVELISLNSSMYVLMFYIDWMSSVFLFIVSTISSVVIFYSKSYMTGEVNLSRFIILILLFVSSMILMIFSLNLISILLGWDGLGLVSYCLVIFYQNVKSFNSGMLTVLSNRIGDVMLLMSISWMINFGSWNFMTILYMKEISGVVNVILIMVVLAAMTKSAQIPFSAWLPAAMAAPTPVSSLVHSSTLVTAGVYLMIRFNEILMMTFMNEFLLLMSSLTMLMAGLSANFEFDLKKIIALSTLSQLGLMMSILCLGFSNMAFFHLSTHAMFKALLFMCAGLLIHNLNNNQDVRFMGSLGYFMPLVSINFNISNLALCGVPFMAGFYSKDLILEMLLFSNFNMIIFFFFFFSTGLTVSYTVRLLYFSMMGEIKFNKIFSFMDKDLIMIKSMLILLLMSIFSGSILNWLIMPFFYMIFISFIFKMMVFIFIFGGILFGGFISMLNYVSGILFMNKLFYWGGNMWFITNISVYGLNMFMLNLSLKFDKILDLGIFEELGGMNLYNKFILFSKMNYYLYFNSIKLFIFFFFFMYMFIIMF